MAMKKGRGRESLIETHPEKADTIVENLSVGASRVDAVRAAGIVYQTFLNWMEKGIHAQSRLDAGEKLSKYDLLFLDFANRVEAAEAQCAVDAQMIVYSAMAKGDVQTAKWWLELRRPEQFGRNTESRFMVTAKVENSGTVAHSHSIDPSTAKEVIDILTLAGAFDVATETHPQSVDDAQPDA